MSTKLPLLGLRTRGPVPGPLLTATDHLEEK